jgi:hypothetical protein
MPDWRTPLASRLAPLALPPAREREIIDELAQHLNDRYRDLLDTGATPEEAMQPAYIVQLVLYVIRASW